MGASRRLLRGRRGPRSSLAAQVAALGQSKCLIAGVGHRVREGPARTRSEFVDRRRNVVEFRFNV
jgi:hypothetical protein